MAFQPCSDAALVIIEYGSEQLRWTNTLWFTQSSFNDEAMDDLMSLVAAWADTYIMPSLCDVWTRREITVYDMRTVEGTKLVSESDGDDGGVVDDPASIQSALVVSFYTDKRGKSGRGRNYITGFGETDAGANLITDAAVVTAMETAYGALQALAGAQGWAWVVMSRYSEGVPRASGVGRYIFSQNVRSAVYGSQRRRVPRD